VKNFAFFFGIGKIRSIFYIKELILFLSYISNHRSKERHDGRLLENGLEWKSRQYCHGNESLRRC